MKWTGRKKAAVSRVKIAKYINDCNNNSNIKVDDRTL